MPNGITKEEIYDNLYDYLSEELADMSDDINDLEQASFLRALDEMLDYQSGKKQPDTLRNDSARMVFNLVIPKLTGDESFRIAPNLPYGSEQIDKAFEKVYGYAKEKHERRAKENEQYEQPEEDKQPEEDEELAENEEQNERSAENKWEHKMLNSSWSDIASEYAELIKNDIIARGGKKARAEADARTAEEALKVIVHNLQDMTFSEPSVAEDNERAVIQLGDIALNHKLGMNIKAYHHHVSFPEVMGILREIRDLPQKRLADEKIENEIRDQLHEDTPHGVASEYAGFVRDKVMARHGNARLADRVAQTVQENLIPLVNNFQEGNYNWMVYVEQNQQAFVNITSQLNLLDLGVHFPHNLTQIKSGDIVDLLKQLRNMPELPRVEREAEAKVEEKPEVKVEAKPEPQPEVKAEAKSEPQPEVKVNAEEDFQEKLRHVSPQQFAKAYAELVKNEIIARGGNENSAKMDSMTVENAVYTLVYNFKNSNLDQFSVIDENYEALKKLNKLSKDNKLDLKFPSNYSQPKGKDIADVMKQIGDLPNMRPVAKEAEAKAEPLGMTPDIRARYIRTTLTGLVAFNDPNMDPTQMEKLANTFANLADYAMEQPSARADFVDKGLETLFKQYPEQEATLKTICTAEDLNLSENERVREVLRLCYMTEMSKLSPKNFVKLSEFNPFTAKQVPGVSKPAHKEPEKQAQKQAQSNPMHI